MGLLDFLWRGAENGWIFTLKDSGGLYGSFILTKEPIIGQMALSQKEWLTIISDPDVTGKELLPITFYGDQTGFDFLEIPLANLEDITAFISFIKAKIKYNT